MKHFNVFRDNHISNHISKTNIWNFTKLLILLDLDKCKSLFSLSTYNSTGPIAIFCFFTVSTIGISQKQEYCHLFLFTGKSFKYSNQSYSKKFLNLNYFLNVSFNYESAVIIIIIIIIKHGLEF